MGLVGASLYMALVVSHDLLSSERVEIRLAGKVPSGSTPKRLRSWGTDLPALATRPAPSPGIPTATAAVDDLHLNHGSGSFESADAASSQSAAYDPTEWVSIRLAARVHREASVSSPTMRFYQPGITLQVVSRENGWAQIGDPASRQSGWALEQYLAPADGPTVTATVTMYKASPEPAQVKPVSSAKKRAHVSRPTVRAPDAIAVAQFESRWLQRTERRRGWRLFGRFARAE